jgi:hypothetical protein
MPLLPTNTVLPRTNMLNVSMPCHGVCTMVLTRFTHETVVWETQGLRYLGTLHNVNVDTEILK